MWNCTLEFNYFRIHEVADKDTISVFQYSIQIGGKEVYLKNPEGALKTVWIDAHFSYSTAAILAMYRKRRSWIENNVSAFST